MTIGELAALAAPSLVSGLLIFALRGSVGSNRRLGERMGKVEQWIDIEEGRRKGYAEAMNERQGDGK